MVTQLPKSVSEEEINTVRRLIIQGKLRAIQGDKRFIKISNAIRDLGFSRVNQLRQAQQIKSRREAPKLAGEARAKIARGERLTVQDLVDIEVGEGRGKQIKFVSPKVKRRGFNIPVRDVGIGAGKTQFEKKKKTSLDLSRFGINLEKLKSSFDIISGGVITRKNLKNQQTKLNTQIEKFNREFGDRELTPVQFNQAQQLSQQFEQEQKKIEEEKRKFKFTGKETVRSFLFGTEEDPFFFNFDVAIQKEKKDLKQTQQKIDNLKGKTGVINNLNRKRLKSVEKLQEESLKKLQSGLTPVILKGTFPLTPVGTLPTNAKIVFVGKQKKIGNKIITDIAFKIGNKTVGVAKGVSVIKGKNAVSVVVGRTGVKVLKIPSGKITTVKRKSFVAIEKILTKPSALKIKKTIQLLKNKRKIGTIKVIKENVKALQQRSLGQIVTVRGDKIFRTGLKVPSGKIVKKKGKGFNFDSFASISSIFTKKDLSLIIGKTITGKGNKAKFIGIIKGTYKLSKSGRLSSTQHQQFKTALNKVIAAASASVAKSSKIKGLSQLGKIATASTIAVETAKAQVSKVKQKPAQVSKTKQTAKQILKISQKARQGLKTAQTPKQISRLISGLTTKQAQKLSTKQLSALKQALLTGTGFRTGTGISALRVLPIIKIPSLKKKKIIKKKVKGKLAGYDVFAKSKGKFIKLNPKPLSKQSAKRLGGSIVDRTISATFKIKPTGKVKKFGKVRATFPKQKFRSFKRVSGRKVKLKNKFIEKRGRRIDTRGEKRGLTVAKLLAQQRKPQVKRKVTSTQLKNLARGRKIRMQNLKKK